MSKSKSTPHSPFALHDGKHGHPPNTQHVNSLKIITWGHYDMTIMCVYQISSVLKNHLGALLGEATPRPLQLGVGACIRRLTLKKKKFKKNYGPSWLSRKHQSRSYSELPTATPMSLSPLVVAESRGRRRKKWVRAGQVKPASYNLIRIFEI